MLCLFTVGFSYSSPLLNDQSYAVKTLSWISQTQPISWMEKNVQTKINKFFRAGWHLVDDPASGFYQTLSHEAQMGVGIPFQEHLPIRRLDPTRGIPGMMITEPDALYVNETVTRNLPYGLCRSALFHEAIHRKYRDVTTAYILSMGTLVGAFWATNTLLKSKMPAGKKWAALRIIMAMVAGLKMASLVRDAYQCMMERRADIEGFYAAQCFICVQDPADDRVGVGEESPLKTNGYLASEEIQQIVEHLKQHNKLCAHHGHDLRA
jgi:hypothetical protein